MGFKMGDAELHQEWKAKGQLKKFANIARSVPVQDVQRLGVTNGIHLFFTSEQG